MNAFDCNVEISLMIKCVFCNSRSPAFQMPVQPALNQDESHGPNNRVQFREPLSNTFMDDAYADVQADSNTTLENSTYVAVDDPSPSNYPILAPVLEEPSSSFSEGNGLIDRKSVV